jgi:hypothetical protein
VRKKPQTFLVAFLDAFFSDSMRVALPIMGSQMSTKNFDTASFKIPRYPNHFPDAAFSSLVGAVHPNRLGLPVTTDQGD